MAATQRTVGGLHLTAEKNYRGGTKLCTEAVLRADAITDTHTLAREVIDPSDLGSDPDSRLCWKGSCSLGRVGKDTHKLRLSRHTKNGWRQMAERASAKGGGCNAQV